MKRIKIIIALWTLCNVIAAAARCQDAPAHIGGRLGMLQDGDTVQLTLYKYGWHFEFGEDPFMKTYSCIAADHAFHFDVEIIGYPKYIFMKVFPTRKDTIHLKGVSIITGDRFIESGDRIEMRQDGDHFYYSGPGSEKYGIRDSACHIPESFHWPSHTPVDRDSLVHNELDKFNSLDELTAKRFRYLDAHKSRMSKDALYLLKADFWGEAEDLKPYWLAWDNAEIVSLLGRSYHNRNGDKLRREVLSDRVASTFSDYFTDGIIATYKLDSCLFAGRKFSLPVYYRYLLKNYTGMLRDRLLTNLLFKRQDTSEDLAALVNKAFKSMPAGDFHTVLAQLRSYRVKGAAVADYVLTDTTGKPVHLKDLDGNVVLVDFWFTGCGACRELAPILAKIEKQYRGKPVVFLSVSFDKEMTTWLKSVRAGQYSSTDCLNVYTGGKAEKHPMTLDLHISGAPTLILIDKAGRLCANPVDPRQDDGASLIRLIDGSLSATR